VPREVIARAREFLTALESQRDTQKQSSAQSELPLFATPAAPTAPDPLKTALAELDPDTLSPKAALEALYRLRELLGKPS
jgi:Mismatch repair ATPase (MutS family)